VNSSQCAESELSGTGVSCVWVGRESTSGNGRCEDVKTSCEAIEDEEMCETVGAVISVSGSNSLECLWLIGNTSSTTTPTSRCVLKVFSFLFFIFCYFFFYVSVVIFNTSLMCI
jgi:hypothetical protein